MNSKNYAIAYNSMAGTGFSLTEPFIHDNYETLEDLIKEKQVMINNGFKNVTIFSYYENELPESVTWSFVLKHKVEEY